MARSFPTVGLFRHGYHRGEVTEFLLQASRAYERAAQFRETDWDAERVRNAAFRMVRGGYEPRSVDRTLDRLEEAFTKRERTALLRADPDEWRIHRDDLRATLTPRLERPSRQRFARPRFLRVGYAADEVDTLLENVRARLAGAGGPTAAEVRTTTFSRARGARAYDEAVVDVYLDRVVEVLILGD